MSNLLLVYARDMGFTSMETAKTRSIAATAFRLLRIRHGVSPEFLA